jgi:hypothetical protein
MPVILTREEELAMWLAAPWPEAAAKWSAKAGDKDIGGVATHIFERQPGGALKLKLHTFN